MTPGEEIRQEYLTAEERFREALEQFPRSPGLLARLGKCLFLQGRIDEAIECLLSSLEMEPAQPSLLLRAADLFAIRERFEEAMRFYEHYQHLRPNSPRGYARMGDLLLRQGFVWSAADAYGMALARRPDSKLLQGRMDAVLRLCNAREA
ncbi:MAG: tetratricopeptide repeat protein [Candidatus Eisenbacteria bacterium]